MNYSFVKQNIKDGILTKNFLRADKNGLIENEVDINNEYLNSTLREIFFGDIRIFSVNHKIKRERIFHPSGRYPPIQMHFLLEGGHSLKSKKTGAGSKFTKNQHNLFYFPHSEMDFTIDTDNVSLLGIQFTKKFFYRFVDENSRLLSKFWEDIEKNNEAKLVSKENLFITPKIKSVISDIINPRHKGYLKRLFLEAKVIELFINQLEQTNLLNNVKPGNLKNDDREKLYAVKDILEQNTLSNFSLLGLARKVGINDFKLKKGFKELFGTTVFNYLRQLKMDEAKRMILDDNKKISEVSTFIGYSEPHHFSKAFKRRFGYLPSKLKS